jgi:GGDEF domain-containing protein
MYEKQKLVEHPAIESVTDVRLLAADKWHQSYHDTYEFAKAERKSLVVFFADNNLLKKINDNLGHSKGDEVIEASKKVAAVSVAAVRTVDQKSQNKLKLVLGLSRAQPRHKSNAEASLLHGDEVAGYFFGSTEEAEEFCRDYKGAFQKVIERPENKQLADFGASVAIGYAILEDGMTEEELLAKADSKMYEDKSDGVVRYSVAQQIGVTALRQDAEAMGINLEDLGRQDQKEQLDNKRYQRELPMDYPENRAT